MFWKGLSSQGGGKPSHTGRGSNMIKQGKQRCLKPPIRTTGINVNESRCYLVAKGQIKIAMWLMGFLRRWNSYKFSQVFGKKQSICWVSTYQTFWNIWRVFHGWKLWTGRNIVRALWMVEVYGPFAFYWLRRLLDSWDGPGWPQKKICFPIYQMSTDQFGKLRVVLLVVIGQLYTTSLKKICFCRSH